MDTTKGTKAKDSKPFVWVSCCIRQDNKVRIKPIINQNIMFDGLVKKAMQ